MFFIENLTEKLKKNFLGSTVRHGLTALGAVLVAKGIADPEQVGEFVSVNTPIIVGSITYVIGYLLSLAKK